MTAPRILIVEDEPAIAESVAYALTRDGFHTSVAADIAQAQTLLAPPAPSLMLLDLMLPDGSGFDLIARVRRQGLALPIIVLSSRDEEADRVSALETGADDYVTKPFSPREVVARVRAVLRRTQASPPPQRATPPLSIDADRRRCTVHGRALDLTRVEFDLLLTLVASAGRVLSRSQLIDRVWGDGFALSDRTIDSHIKSLRRKLSDAGGDVGWVETVRGVGYRAPEALSVAAALSAAALDPSSPEDGG